MPRQSLKRLLKDEAGQGMVEFAIVLPILLLLTLGTIMLTLSYIQKARMNGLAYMSARVAAVRRENFDAAGYTLKQYGERSGQAWLSEVTPGAPASGADRVAVSLRKPGERIDVLANLVSGQPTAQPFDLVVQMSLPREFPNEASFRTQTYTEVDYQYKPLGLISLLERLPDRMLDATQMADRMNGGIAERNAILSLEPPNTRLQEKFYAHRDIRWSEALASNSEKPASSQFSRMQTIYNNFTLIEQGGNLAALLADISGFGGPIKEVVSIVGSQAAGTWAKTMHEVSGELERNVGSSYRSSP